MNLLTIRDLCKKNEVSIRSVATHIGMSEQNLHRCIKVNKIEANDLYLIAQYFNVPIGYFFGEDGSLPNEKVQLNSFIKEIDLLRELLKEKERTIQILIKSQ